MKELDEFPRESLLAKISGSEAMVDTVVDSPREKQSEEKKPVPVWLIIASASGGVLLTLVACGLVFFLLSRGGSDGPAAAPQDIIEANQEKEAMVVDRVDGVNVFESSEIVVGSP